MEVQYLILKRRVVKELVDLREDVDAGVAERTLLLLRDDAREHPPHHVDLVAAAALCGGRAGRQDDGDAGKDSSHFYRGFWSNVLVANLSLTYRYQMIASE